MPSKNKEYLELVTVDWDYCVPIHAVNQWGHHEQGALFYETIWTTRHHYMECKGRATPTPLIDVGSMIKLPLFGVPLRLGISESHLNAFCFFKDFIRDTAIGASRTARPLSSYDAIRIHLFDLHHDMWPIPEGVEFDASSWLRHLLTTLPIEYDVEVIWYPPPWMKSRRYPLDGFGFERFSEEVMAETRAQITRATAIPEKLEPDALLWCRSGPWTPPHLDWEFMHNAMEHAIDAKETLKFTAGPFDPLKPREVLYSRETFEQMIKGFKQLSQTMYCNTGTKRVDT